jgi:hypothetical protein
MSATKPQLAELHSRLFEEGLEVRRAVLGHEYVDNAVKNATPFTRPGQELITEWAWGTIWKRPGLDRKQRSLLSKCKPCPPPCLDEPRGIVILPCHTLLVRLPRHKSLPPGYEVNNGGANGKSRTPKFLFYLPGKVLIG